MYIYLAQLLLEWEMFQSWRENQNTHFVFNNSTPSPEKHAVCVEKYGRIEQATYDNI